MFDYSNHSSPDWYPGHSAVLPWRGHTGRLPEEVNLEPVVWSSKDLQRLNKIFFEGVRPIT